MTNMKLIVKTIRVIDQYSQTYFTMIGRFLGLSVAFFGLKNETVGSARLSPLIASSKLS